MIAGKNIFYTPAECMMISSDILTTPVQPMVANQRSAFKSHPTIFEQ